MTEFRRLEFIVEQKHFLDLLALSQKRYRATLRYFFAAMVAALVVTAFGIASAPCREAEAERALLAIVSAAIGITIFCTLWQFPKVRFVDDEGSFLGGIVLNPRRDGLHWEHERGVTVFYPWAAFKIIDQTKNTLVIFTDATVGVTIATSAFETDDERAEFIGFVEQKISQ